MSQARASAAAQVLDELVHQFSNATSCFRELIQNSVDAGSAEIEVNFSFDAEPGSDADEVAGPGAKGVIVAEVRDWGAGMDREIIEERLTRLFASAKEGDATKIGKFGIGFVSVFALDPAAICVDTGRGGEAWRVLFDRARGFSTLRLDEPLEGTRVRLLIDGERSAFESLRAKASAAIQHWCQHVQVELRVDGTRIDRPLGFEALVQVSDKNTARTVVVGHRQSDSVHGFYNGGITLEAGPTRVDELAGLSFKILAGDLEHTLTRDGVVRNDAFEDAVGEVIQLADGPLRVAVAAGLAQQLEADAGSPTLEPWYAALAFHVGRALAVKGKLEPGFAATAVGLSSHGGPLTLGDLQRSGRRGPIRIAASASPAAKALHGDSRVVLIAQPSFFALQGLCRLLAGGAEAIDVDAQWAMPALVEPEHEPRAFSRMRDAIRCLLHSSGHKVSEIRLGGFRWPGSRISDRIAVTLDKLGVPEKLHEIGDLNAGLLRRRRPLVLNLEHSLVAESLRLAKQEPELAAYMVLKASRLEVGPLDPSLEAPWSLSCWEQRSVRCLARMI